MKSEHSRVEGVVPYILLVFLILINGESNHYPFEVLQKAHEDLRGPKIKRQYSLIYSAIASHYSTW